MANSDKSNGYEEVALAFIAGCGRNSSGVGASVVAGPLLGPTAALATTQLANVMAGVGAAARLAYSAGTVAFLAYAGSLIGSFWLREPGSPQLPE